MRRASDLARRVGATMKAGVMLAVCAGMLGCGSLGAGSKPAWEQPPPPPKAEPIVAEGALTRVVLENGLELMLLE
ncbi:MAG: hypothetical protein OEV20_08505, partial [Actinomycetota bacterium]|nr:hypothetical protein [Actinomycetota bacterium]